jgi:hypothetical protein
VIYLFRGSLRQLFFLYLVLVLVTDGFSSSLVAQASSNPRECQGCSALVLVQQLGLRRPHTVPVSEPGRPQAPPTGFSGRPKAGNV